eukprot:TRINITY_DN24830_c0_g1_i1.p1 TRINITY_DN24830_c0_g1~~TRINITY_DN24830_c0_g1_i1.p1  ORF type:complete len:663 (-),score=124.73 TRINITY_DN24830_c0_g1_i1:276-2264(-)
MAALPLIETLRRLDTQATGVISLVQLDRFLQHLDPWWDTEKLNLLSTAAGIISENGHINYEDFVEWLVTPGSVPCTPRPNLRSAASSRPVSQLHGRRRSSLTVRFVHVNDVYDLSRFPALKTAIDQLSFLTDADKVVTTMGGDFLAPYLLSSMDHGAGMLECMNASGFSHCCFGNHECDVPHAALLNAIDTFRGTWINSNMKGGGFGENQRLPTYDVLEVTSQDKAQTRRVGMLGLLCGDSFLYRDGSFNGAVPTIERVNDACARLCQDLRVNERCDVVVPMTHQNSPEDFELSRRSRELRVPAILGGHDHLEVCEVCDVSECADACPLVKAGMDAVKVGVVDLTWDDATVDWPQVDARLLTTLDFAPDAEVQKVVDRHMAKVWALDHMVACYKADMLELAAPGTVLPLSSVGTRRGESSMATVLCSGIRNAMGTEVCLLEGGSVRAGSDRYVDRITMSDLKAELPFKNDTVAVRIPGAVLSEAVRFSRLKAAEKPYAFFLHCDNGCVVDASTHELVQVAGEPLNAERLYVVSLGIDLGVGAGVNEPLMRWAKANAQSIPDKDLARPARELLELYFVRQLWKKLPAFDAIDTGGEGYLTCEEIERAYTDVFLAGDASDDARRLAAKDMARHFVKVLDEAGDQRVSREEYGALLRESPPVLVA